MNRGVSHPALDSLPSQIPWVILHDDPFLAAGRPRIYIGSRLRLASLTTAIIVLDSVSLRLHDASAQRLEREGCTIHLASLLLARWVRCVRRGEDAGQDSGHQWLARRKAATDDAEARLNTDDAVERSTMPCVC
jgi:hypothetical protein